MSGRSWGRELISLSAGWQRDISIKCGISPTWVKSWDISQVLGQLWGGSKDWRVQSSAFELGRSVGKTSEGKELEAKILHLWSKIIIVLPQNDHCLGKDGVHRVWPGFEPLGRAVCVKITYLADLKSQILASIKSQILANLRSQILANLKSQNLMSMKSQILTRIKSQILASIQSQILTRIKSQILANLKFQIFLQTHSSCPWIAVSDQAKEKP